MIHSDETFSYSSGVDEKHAPVLDKKKYLNDEDFTPTTFKVLDADGEEHTIIRDVCRMKDRKGKEYRIFRVYHRDRNKYNPQTASRPKELLKAIKRVESWNTTT